MRAYTCDDTCMRCRDTKEPLETDAVLQQGILFIAAGYETTSMAIAFTAYLLARNPDAEAKLLAEIDAQGRDAVPTWETLEKWPYAQVRAELALSGNC